jgi:hypothetical protein
MGLLEFLWEAQKDEPIRRAEEAAARNAQRLQPTVDTSLELRVAVERLALVSQAMWELLRERTNLAESDLLAKVQEIDLRSGREDGKRKRSPLKCAKCGKPNGVQRVRCLYCNEPLAPDSAFDTVRP